VKFFHALLAFFLHLGYFGPLVMGVLDSSFLVLPFGNDLLLVWLVAAKHHGAPWYVLAAAAGSTLGALLVALVARKVGKEGICRFAGEKQFNRLQKRLSHRAAVAIALGALAPPPFPYTVVVAAASALDQSLAEILVTNFVARAARFAILAYLAMRFGKQVVQVAQSAPFRWTVIGFTIACLIASGFSVWRWVHGVRSGKRR
jgi:membrane protein YqaA with SNARE-associated domain